MPIMTEVLLQTAPPHLSIVFGTPEGIVGDLDRALAVFQPGRVVAYLAREPPAQALYIFKTALPAGAPDRLRHVSRPVKLLYVATTARTAKKATSALAVLRKGLTEAGVDALPDLFWYRLADFIERRGRSIARQAAGLLDAEARP